MKQKPIKTMTFDELVDMATRRIHSALLEGGGKEMKSEVYTMLSNAIIWSANKNLQTKIMRKMNEAQNN